MYELNRHKKSDAIKWVIVFVTMLVILTIVLAILSSGFTNWNVKTWFGQKDETEQTEPGTEDKGKGDVVIDNVKENGVKLALSRIATEDYHDYGVSAMAETAYTLTATIAPATADNKLVDWSVSWVNPSSEWANGKTVTDYVTATPQSDGSLTTTIACLLAFSEKIKVTVTSRDNTELAAFATVDYRATVLDISWDLKNIDGSTAYAINTSPTVTCSASSNVQLSSEITPTLGAGTLTETYNTKSATLAFSNEFSEYLRTSSSLSNYIGESFVSLSLDVSSSFSFGQDTYNGCFFSGNVPPQMAQQMYSMLINEIKGYNGAVLKFDCALVGADTNKEFNRAYSLSVNKDALKTFVTSVTLVPDSIIF